MWAYHENVPIAVTAWEAASTAYSSVASFSREAVSDATTAISEEIRPTPDVGIPPSSFSMSTPTSQLSLPSPDQRHYDYKAYMLELVNQERIQASVPELVLGNNVAAQLHAEGSLTNCVSGHWGVDGLKPYMRYSLAGGYQYDAENGSGLRYCIRPSDGYRALDSIESEVRIAMDGWMGSPEHRRNLLNPWHRQVNIGLAWDTYNFVAIQHFEGEYVKYDKLPQITNGTLSFQGHTLNELRFSNKEKMGLQLYFDPPPHSLTRGQVSRTYCYDSGLQVAAFRYPLTGGSFWDEVEFTTTHLPCPDPYDVSPESPGPRSPEEAHRFHQQSSSASANRVPQPIKVPWITASKWTARGVEFSVVVDIGDLLSEHGPGVYTMLLWAVLDGEDVPVSQYSIFYEVVPPDTYDPAYEE